MRVTQAEPEFRPVTIVLETLDEYDMLMACLHNVAEGKINHTPPVIDAARQLRNYILNAIED